MPMAGHERKKRESPWPCGSELGVGSSVFLCAWCCKKSCNNTHYATAALHEEAQRPDICMLRIARALFSWGMVDPEQRIARLKAALDKAVEDVIENQGKEITQGNVGDSSFQFAPGSMTVDLWVEALGLAIRSIEQGKFEVVNVARIVF